MKDVTLDSFLNFSKNTAQKEQQGEESPHEEEYYIPEDYIDKAILLYKYNEELKKAKKLLDQLAKILKSIDIFFLYRGRPVGILQKYVTFEQFRGIGYILKPKDENGVGPLGLIKVAEEALNDPEIYKKIGEREKELEILEKLKEIEKKL